MISIVKSCSYRNRLERLWLFLWIKGKGKIWQTTLAMRGLDNVDNGSLFLWTKDKGPRVKKGRSLIMTLYVVCGGNLEYIACYYSWGGFHCGLKEKWKHLQDNRADAWKAVVVKSWHSNGLISILWHNNYIMALHTFQDLHILGGVIRILCRTAELAFCTSLTWLTQFCCLALYEGHDSMCLISFSVYYASFKTLEHVILGLLIPTRSVGLYLCKIFFPLVPVKTHCISIFYHTNISIQLYTLLIFITILSLLICDGWSCI